MSKPLMDTQEFLALIETTNVLALDKALQSIGGNDMFATRSARCHALSFQLFRAMIETRDFIAAVREYELDTARAAGLSSQQGGLHNAKDL